MTRSKDHICVLFPRKCFSGRRISAVTHLLTRCKNQYITGFKAGKTTMVFSKDWSPMRVWARKSLRTSQETAHTPHIFPTRDLTAVKLEAQCDAVGPRLRSDSYKAGQDRLWDPIENHLCGIWIPMENLLRGRSRWDFMLILSPRLWWLSVFLWTVPRIQETPLFGNHYLRGRTEGNMTHVVESHCFF